MNFIPVLVPPRARFPPCPPCTTRSAWQEYKNTRLVAVQGQFARPFMMGKCLFVGCWICLALQWCRSSYVLYVFLRFHYFLYEYSCQVTFIIYPLDITTFALTYWLHCKNKFLFTLRDISCVCHIHLREWLQHLPTAVRMKGCLWREELRVCMSRERDVPKIFYVV